MAAYCAYVDCDAEEGPGPVDSLTLVPDGFSWAAYVFGPVWCVWRRCWSGLIVWTLAGLGVAALFAWSEISPVGILAIIELMLLIFGLEAAALWRWSLEHRGMRLADVLIASNREQAERLFFEHWAQNQPRQTIAPGGTATRMPPTQGIGLFADAGG